MSTPILGDPIENVTTICPQSISTNSVGECTVLIDKGTNMTVSVDYGDSTSDSFQISGRFSFILNQATIRVQKSCLFMKDSQIVNYGIQVSQSPVNIVNGPGYPGFYILPNTLVLFDGMLRALEIYASASGMITIYVNIICFSVSQLIFRALY
jgi:hypothetical protein